MIVYIFIIFLEVLAKYKDCHWSQCDHEKFGISLEIMFENVVAVSYIQFNLI